MALDVLGNDQPKQGGERDVSLIRELTQGMFELLWRDKLDQGLIDALSTVCMDHSWY